MNMLTWRLEKNVNKLYPGESYYRYYEKNYHTRIWMCETNGGSHNNIV